MLQGIIIFYKRLVCIFYIDIPATLLYKVFNIVNILCRPSLRHTTRRKLPDSRDEGANHHITSTNSNQQSLNLPLI
jgi:hypothetical protein